MVLSVLTFIMNSWASSAALLLRMIDFPNAAIISSCFRALLAVRLRPADDVPTITFESVSWMEFQHAEGLGIVSDVTGHGDGLAMNIAGGAAKVQAQALEYGLTPAEVAQAARGTAGHFGGTATVGRNQPAATHAASSALLNRGKNNSNKAIDVRNQDALRLGEQIGSEVMGPDSR